MKYLAKAYRTVGLKDDGMLSVDFDFVIYKPCSGSAIIPL